MRSAVALSTVAAALLAITSNPAVADDVPDVAGYLADGRLAEAETALVNYLRKHDDDTAEAPSVDMDRARAGLGIVQFLRGVEQLGQALHRHGSTNRARAIPFLRMPVPVNPDPKPISYAQFRAIFTRLAADLTRSESTLSDVRGADFKLRIPFGRVRLDLDGDGKATDQETLMAIVAGLSGNRGADGIPADTFEVAVDHGDVLWLRGYCHLLLSVVETVLAHDEKELFERVGHVLFAKVDSPYQSIAGVTTRFNFQGNDIFDLIAFIHLLNFPVTEPERMKAAHAHLLEVIALSRKTWAAIEAETDDDREWLPSPGQTGVIPGVRVGPQMVSGWKKFLDEAESILQGKRLIPHPRLTGKNGINLKKVFHDPRRFDIVLWVQGSAAIPYVEEGDVTSVETWRDFQRTFQGQFIGFAIWFN